MHIQLTLLLLLAMVSTPAPQCKANLPLAGPCFVVHGRMRAYNGNPTFRIWRIGTDRLLGVTGAQPGEDPIMPDNLGCDFDHDVYADFEVCPFTAERPGVMQRVCVVSAEKRVIVQRTEDKVTAGEKR
ncbi:MAG: hypothetical protein DMG14_17710 [Acidobacteria bacterium]|nr:MAG: hypothetical protein DMG14_17710 [Acidobacteriota bacterium]